jgi:hypothetical protein
VPRILSPLVLLACLLAGCAGTRIGTLGTLPGGDRLVTVVVSQDRDVVERECNQPLALGPLLGCQISRPVGGTGRAAARTVKVVRYADVLPSSLAFEIEVHELCHVVAALQTLEDPCHADHHGVMDVASRRLR